MKKLLLLLAAVGVIFTACQGGLDNEENGEMPTAQKKTIFYTSSDGNIVTPCRDYVFGARIVSNTYENGKGVIVFDAPVTSIGDYAFYECRSLTSVTIPDSVTSIEYAAFYNCTSLTSVTIGDSVTSIGRGAFRECTSLTSVTIPDSVTSIEYDAFAYCTSLTAFYGKYASADNRCLIVDGVLKSFAPAGLTEYTIPDSVISIGDYAFFYCTSLTSVTIGNSVTSIGDYAFCDCTSLTAFYGKYASADNRCLIVDGVLKSFAPAGLTEYTIPDSVTSIGSSAFYRCTSLTSVIIPDSVTSIGNSAFSSCSKLTSITIPDSVTSIGDYAFYYCTSLTSVTIPDSVTSIGNEAFGVCISLTSVYCKPTTPPAGGSDMFNNNAKGRKIYVPRNSVDAYKAAEYWSDYASYIEGYDF